MSSYLPNYSCIALVLQPTPVNAEAVPLENWLPCFKPSPLWLSLSPNISIVKALAVLPNYQLYPQLMEAIALKLQQNLFIKWRGKCFTISGVETQDFSLYKISVFFKYEKGFNNNIGNEIHTLVLQYFARADSELANQLEQPQQTLPFTAVYNPYSSKEGDLNITVLQKQLLAPLLWGMSQDFGKNIVGNSIDFSQGEFLKGLQAQNFLELNKSKSQAIIKLHFLTPTSFKQNEIIQNFPLPELVFNSLWRKWNYFAPSQLHFPSIDWQAFVCGYDLKTESINLKYSSEIGCLGWVKYQFKDSQQAKIATILANFANFAGVGRKTTMGMGQTQFKETDYER